MERDRKQISSNRRKQTTRIGQWNEDAREWFNYTPKTKQYKEAVKKKLKRNAARYRVAAKDYAVLCAKPVQKKKIQRDKRSIKLLQKQKQLQQLENQSQQEWQRKNGREFVNKLDHVFSNKNTIEAKHDKFYKPIRKIMAAEQKNQKAKVINEK